VNPPDIAPPPRMDHHEKMRMRTAAHHATQVFPGPAGELVQKELLAWEMFGWRLGPGQNALVPRLVEQVEKAWAQLAAERTYA
jgi:hypothetical protein